MDLIVLIVNLKVGQGFRLGKLPSLFDQLMFHGYLDCHYDATVQFDWFIMRLQNKSSTLRLHTRPHCAFNPPSFNHC